MHLQHLVGEDVWAMEMQDHGGLEKHRSKWGCGAGVDDTGIVWSRRYAKSILLQAYLECLNTVCHSKQRDSGSTPRLQTKLVKMLTSKTRTSECGDAYKFCLELWDELSQALIESQESSTVLPSKEELSQMQGYEVMIRLALLADFYRYQKEDLALYREESTEKLCAIRAKAFSFLANGHNVQPERNRPTGTLVSKTPLGCRTRANSSIPRPLLQPQPLCKNVFGTAYRGCDVGPHMVCASKAPMSDYSYLVQVREDMGGYGPPHTGESATELSLSLHEAAARIPNQSGDTLATGSTLLKSVNPVGKKSDRLKPGPCSPSMCTSKQDTGLCDNRDSRERKRPYPQSGERPRDGEASIKWTKLSFSVKRKSYQAKLIRAFQVVKSVGHPMLTLNSEWGLSCYYKLAVSYTTDQPLEMAAACLPELRQAVDIIHSEHFQKLRELPLGSQMLLYAVLNCHINWVDHNHKQILLIPGQPSSRAPNQDGDLRCSRCLKNQTFHSSEVKGNPRNIDVEFDFEQMRFGSSCCAAPMINVPLSTNLVNTCTFTEMKQMYTSCMTCKQPIFSEVLVDMETLYSRCVACTSADPI